MRKKIYIIGHRNPDLDSVGAAHAVCELRRRRGDDNVFAACCGIPGARAEYVFKRFNTPLPPVLHDVYPRLCDIVSSMPQYISSKRPLLDAIKILRESQCSHLPVTNDDGEFLGVLSIFGTLDDMLQLSQNSSGLAGRDVRSSLSLISSVLKTEVLSVRNAEVVQNFSVFVAAMGMESFKEHIPQERPDELALVVGDRPDIHLMAINLGVRLMIVTGSRKVDDVVVAAARERGVSILKTAYDSATVIRRLKFSVPVEALSLPKDVVFYETDILQDTRAKIRNLPDGLFPVVNGKNKLVATFRASDCEQQPLALVLVDHNEFDNGIAGIDTVPIVEIIDHHRFGMPPTTLPIKITCDIVGSTCTLVTELYRRENLSPTAATAGILMGGILSDTMMLRSPTTTLRDKYALKYLETVAGVGYEQLSEEIFSVGSLIMQQTPEKLLSADKKDFYGGNCRFAIAQVEEVSFEPFYAKENEIVAAAESISAAEKLDLFALLVTNIITQNSILVAVGKPNLIAKLPFLKINEHLFDLQGIVSRKKQLLPHLLKWFEQIQTL